MYIKGDGYGGVIDRMQSTLAKGARVQYMDPDTNQMATGTIIDALPHQLSGSEKPRYVVKNEKTGKEIVKGDSDLRRVRRKVQQ
jgi:hypothetical protein